MKRYLLFRFDECEAQGGWGDLRDSFATLDEAYDAVTPGGHDTAQIVDFSSGELVDEADVSYLRVRWQHRKTEPAPRTYEYASQALAAITPEQLGIVPCEFGPSGAGKSSALRQMSRSFGSFECTKPGDWDLHYPLLGLVERQLPCEKQPPDTPDWIRAQQLKRDMKKWR
jgi:hypothetical protein